MPWTKIEADWQRGLIAATAYAKVHGNLDVKTTLVTDGGFSLGQWLANRRKQALNNQLDPRRLKALKSLDTNWQTARSNSSRWETNYQAARAYAEKHGRLPTRKGSARDPAPEGHDFRRWLVEQRQVARSGRLTPERLAALNTLDPNWQGNAPAR